MLETLGKFDTEFCADSVEWCPLQSFRDLFVCGTYELLKNENQLNSVEERKVSKRLGKIFLMRIITEDSVILGVAAACGSLFIYKLESCNKVCNLKLITKINLNNEQSVLALALNWHPKVNNGVKIGISDSKGNISLFEHYEDELKLIDTWNAHSYEAWYTAFDNWNENIIYTGGDDCYFKGFDIRAEKSSAIFSKIFDAGVVSIHSNPSHEHLLALGSYDEHLYLYDTRNFKRSLSSINLNGGVWRLKWNPFENNYLLAACMFNGFRIIDCKNPEEPVACAVYIEPENLCYGCDWSYLENRDIFKLNLSLSRDEKISLVSTCFFYSRTLMLSKVDFSKYL
ncbi:diphthine methyltransferase isoform X2 [Prorops nasuta]|uniref:diphthine methyltransferase isoform X2 n=1 Tax=Prorops nasuta TaxID=863751 RepID=UPI0034CDAB55